MSTRNYLIWFDKNGTKWEYDAAWEGCEFKYEASENPYDGCPNPREYLGLTREGKEISLCKEHFEQIRNEVRQADLIFNH